MLVTNPLELGAALREARETAGMTQRELADALGVVRQTVLNLERGKGTASVKLLFRAVSVLALQIEMSGQALLDPDTPEDRDEQMGAPDLDDVLQRALGGTISLSPDRLKKVVDSDQPPQGNMNRLPGPEGTRTGADGPTRTEATGPDERAQSPAAPRDSRSSHLGEQD